MDRSTHATRLSAAVPAAMPATIDDPEATREAETVAEWLSLYVPTWGTSVVLHVAVVLIMVFVGIQQEILPPPAFAHGSVLISQPPVDKVEPMRNPATDNRNPSQVDRKDPRKDAMTDSRGRNKLGGTFFMTLDPNVLKPDFGDARTRRALEVIGVGDGGDVRGGVEGLGDDTARGRGSTVFRIDQDVDRSKIAYIVDRSGSMTDSIDFVKRELKRSIGSLDANAEFHVIFYSSGAPVEMASRRLVRATDNNKTMAAEFIDGVVPMGETDPSKALERAFAVGADTIYLLTDGEFDRAIIDLVKRLNATGKAKVYTIGFLYSDKSDILKTIATENGGKYKFIKELDEIGE